MKSKILIMMSLWSVFLLGSYLLPYASTEPETTLDHMDREITVSEAEEAAGALVMVFIGASFSTVIVLVEVPGAITRLYTDKESTQ